MTSFHPFEVSPAHVIYVGLGLFICIFSYLSLFIKEKLYLGEAPIAAAFGIIVGPVAINLFNPAGWGGESGQTPGGNITDEITLEIMRVTIALSVFAVGVELPKKYLLRHWRSIAILLGPVMAWGWLLTGLFIWALIPGLDYLTSLVIAACVSPTDPILAQAVVGGPWAEKHVPAHVRHMLMCESGCNDGAAFPFLYLALYLTQNRDNTGKAIAHWFYETWAYEIILGTLLGALIGYLARKFMRFSERHRLIDRESFVAQYISLAIASMGVNVLLGSDDLLAAFACGTAFAWDGWFTKQTEDSNFSNIVDLLFNVATFIYIGALIPWHDFANAEIGLSPWRLIVLTLLVLLLKRLPIILALWKWIPDIKTFREAVFSGHFGPMGVGAIFIATLGRTLMPEEVPENPETPNDVLAHTIQPIVYFFVLCSIVVHGLTVPFFTFGKNAHRRAHTITRTWSKHPSMPNDNEPSWMNRVRRVRSGDDIVINTDDISAEKMSAAQLAMIGRGAIGGYQEDELRSGDDSNTAAGDDSSKGGSFTGLLNARTERDLEKAEGLEPEERRDEMDGIEDWDDQEHFDPTCDYLGDDNCIEVRRYRERMAAKKENQQAEARKSQQMDEEKKRASQEDGDDIGQASMDRDLHYHHNEDQPSRKWPQVRQWVEGHELVVEYQKSYSDDPEVEVIPLREEEMDSINSSDNPAYAWIQGNKKEIGERLGMNSHHHWGPAEAAERLWHHGIPRLWKDPPPKRVEAQTPKEETREERDARANMLYGAMTWASENRDADPPVRSGRPKAPRRSNSGSSTSRSPPPTIRNVQHTAASNAPRRHSLRKKVLCGQIGLQGQRSSIVVLEEHVDEDEEPEEEPPTKPSVTISSPPSRQDSDSLSPVEKKRIPRIGQKPSEKYFPRSSSAGGGLSDSSFQKSTGNISWLDVAGEAERGKNKIASLFSAFTAPKGEGMGNPGPTWHPHLFPKEEEEMAPK